MLYFAYGANMDREGMARRCPGAVAQGLAALEGYRIFITRDGYASVTRAAGACVHGVVWRITPRDLAALNAFESLESGLYRRVMLPVRVGEGRANALVYVGRSSGEGRPRPGYIELVVAAARDWDLPLGYIESVARLAPGGFRGARAVETRDIG
ncbi:MAG: gamma-glutamylcyclotransferase [Rhizobiales bacterium]|nr:gamma-glutamylcyclotransferase [Hyphomicrobiales bacterium]